MSDRSDEQRAADEALDAAVCRVATLEDGYDGELIVDWLVVYAAVPHDSTDRHVYGLAFRDGTMPSYRALGLCTAAMRLIDDDDGADE